MPGPTPTDPVTARDTQAAAFRGWPRRAIAAGGAVRPLPTYARPLAGLTIELEGRLTGVGDYMARHDTAGVLVLKGGEIALELYGADSGPQRRQASYSTAKSVTSALVAAALQDGAIRSLDDPCDTYLPQVRGSTYEGVTIRNLLRMASGVRWNEQTDGHSDVGRLDEALQSRRPGSLLDLACSLPRAHPQGQVFNYSTVETYVLGAVIADATGRTLADYCAEVIWGPAGMEADGYWALEAEAGRELGGAGIGWRLRDMGRFGQLVLEDFEPFNGPRRLPPGWRDLAGQPDSAATAFGRLIPGNTLGYGYQWWVLPHGPTGVHIGAFTAIGAFGQYVYVHPAQQVVVAIQSRWPEHSVIEAELQSFALFRAAVLALQADP